MLSKLLTVSILFFFSTGLMDCQTRSQISNQTPNQEKTLLVPTPSIKPAPLSETDCEKWQRFYNRLSDAAKKDLQTDGFAGSGDLGGNGYILSSKLVSDCYLRNAIGRLIYRHLVGIDDEMDVQFAAENSKEIIRVLRHIWNLDTLNDGAGYVEKYSILYNQGLPNEEIAPFIGEIIESEKQLTGSHVSILINRSLPILKPTLSKLLRRNEDRGDLAQQIYILIILQQNSPNPSFLHKLEILAQNKNLRAETKRNLKKIMQKLNQSERIQFDEIEKLDLPMKDG